MPLLPLDFCDHLNSGQVKAVEYVCIVKGGHEHNITANVTWLIGIGQLVQVYLLH